MMGETPVNRASSRSHAVFTLTIMSEREVNSENPEGGDEGGYDHAETRTIVTRGELKMVDLAGSERMYKNDGDG